MSVFGIRFKNNTTKVWEVHKGNLSKVQVSVRASKIIMSNTNTAVWDLMLLYNTIVLFEEFSVSVNGSNGFRFCGLYRYLELLIREYFLICI